MSNLLVPFLYALRRRDIKVGTTETVTLAEALSRGLHEHTLDGFYYVARAVLVHRESDLDAFDRVFFEHFRGAEVQAGELLGELAAWSTGEQSDGAAGNDLDAASADALRELIGRALDDRDTGEDGEGGARSSLEDDSRVKLGRNPLASGAPRSTAVGMADARRYKQYRSDVVLDVRQIEVALRRLRSFSRDGNHLELDVDATIDKTARAFGDLELVLRPPRRSNVRVLLLMDVGGSMEPYAKLCSQIFSAAKRASNLRELKTFYFHNVVYGRVFTSDGSMEPVDVPELLQQVNQRWKLVFVGDASMAPGEMLSVGPWSSSWRRPDGGPMRGFDWLMALAERFDRSVWLNPDPPSYWVGGTVEVISQVFQMHTLSLDGLTEAVTYLSKDAPGKRPEFKGNPRNAL